MEASLKALMETANSSIGDNLPVYTGVDIPIDQSAHGENSENAEVSILNSLCLPKILIISIDRNEVS